MNQREMRMETRTVRHMVHEGGMAHQAGRGMTKPRSAREQYEVYEQHPQRQTDDWEDWGDEGEEEEEVFHNVLPRRAPQKRELPPHIINKATVEIAALNRLKNEGLPSMLEGLFQRLQGAVVEEVEGLIDERIDQLQDFIEQGG